jgi:hypothetical protein
MAVHPLVTDHLGRHALSSGTVRNHMPALYEIRRLPAGAMQTWQQVIDLSAFRAALPDTRSLPRGSAE